MSQQTEYRCSTCGETKPRDGFYTKDKRGHRSSKCKTCFIRMIYQRQRDSGARLEIQTTRRLRKLNRVPAWADVPAMRRVYEESRRRRDAGEDVQVDHIVPLKSKLVSGLHVPANLQIIDTEWNRIKANEWWPDMP